MRRIGLLLMLLAGLAAPAYGGPSSSTERTVSVRLFWQHPPSKIHIVPTDSSLRRCATCPAAKLASPVDLQAHQADVLLGPQRCRSLILAGRARVEGDGFAPFSINGTLRIESRDNFLLLTLSMPLEDYVVAVLAGESSSFRSDEALKAMAVAARTFAAHFGSRHQLESFDFCDTTHCQDVRLGLDSPRVRAAVTMTAGELLWYEGRPAATYYHRSCGGEIDNALALDRDLRVPYLRRHRDDYCARPDEWHAEIAKADLARIFSSSAISSAGPATNLVRVVSRDNTGRVRTLVLNGRQIDATNFRFAIGHALGWDKLRSDLYEIEDLGTSVNFRGRGQGHGVGLCQNGADNMGQQGHTYREILAYYYPGTSLGVGAQGLPWQKLSGERIDVLTTRAADAQAIIPIAERELAMAEQRTGWTFNARPQLKIFPSIEIYRDATGEPGWVAASTRGQIIRLQPLEKLRKAGALGSTLRHEFLHMLVESHATKNTPLWLREGLVIYLSNPEIIQPLAVDISQLDARLNSARTEVEMRAAYRDCAGAVALQVRQRGLAAVLKEISGM